ncbi:MAG TPA: ABC transporter ATP-binding protein [Thermoanaerobaculia bacterium]|jgi:ABC-type Fe3+/spermidine/putrescine transport system ATPase subunit|nr:ABC transporter ATP-binding protein [Thermoanaerobaculia bacterium]
MERAIELKNIVFGFDRRRILDGLSLFVEANEVLSLIGPSGCGKSTTLRLISGLIAPEQGEVLLFGRRAESLAPKERSIATVWQGKALFPHLSVRKNIEFGLRVRQIAPEECRRRVDEVAERFRIQTALDRDVLSLSGGEQQRVALARALVVKPRILLLDEPFTGLDRGLAMDLKNDLLELVAEGGRTFVLVSHDFADALSLSRRVAILQNGRIEQLGSPRDLWLEPSSAFVAEFLGRANVVPCRAITASSNGDFLEVTDGNQVWIGRNRTGAVEAGQPLAYVLQPSEIRLDGSGDSHLTGAYLSSDQMETHMTYHFKHMPSGRDMRVMVPQSINIPVPGLGYGDQARLSWNSSSALIVPDRRP